MRKGGGGAGGGSMGCDARSSSLQRMVRRSVGLERDVAKSLKNARTRWKRANHGRRKAGTQQAHGSQERQNAWPCPEAWQAEPLNRGCGCVVTEPRGEDDELGSDVE